MTEFLSPQQATERLDSVLTPDGMPSVYIAAYQTPAGRQLAVSRELKETQVWLEVTR